LEVVFLSPLLPIYCITTIARRANSTGNIYEKDLADIKDMLNKTWQPLLYFQSQVLRLKR
jgi:hypothetical protein